MENNPLYLFLSTLSGAMLTFLGIYVKEKYASEKEVKLAEINSECSDQDQIKANLHTALITVQELKIELHKEKDLRRSIESKFETVKKVYSVIFTQYAITFKDDPDQIALLNKFNEIIAEE
jgi:ribosomal protein L17